MREWNTAPILGSWIIVAAVAACGPGTTGAIEEPDTAVPDPIEVPDPPEPEPEPGDTSPPCVIAQQPPPNTEDVPLDVTIDVTLNEIIDCAAVPADALELTGTTASLRCDVTSGETILSLIPASPLNPSSRYSVTLYGRFIVDGSGNAMPDDITWAFETRASPPPPAVLVGAADVADCGLPGDEMTAELLDGVEGTVFVAGDTAYQSGSAKEFAQCYEPSWGRHRARTRPAVGNHEYRTPGAAGYFDYYGEAAGDRDKGYYSYDLGGWHIVVLNSECGQIGGCDSGSPQMKWLLQDLAAHPTKCTVAYYHRPRFSSGEHGNSSDVVSLWRALCENGVDVVINGHDHHYERFAPQDAEGRTDALRGIRQFVVGTGGGELRGIRSIQPNSEVRNTNTWGVLKLTLREGSYDWEFLPVAGKSFRDSGSGTCH